MSPKWGRGVEEREREYVFVVLQIYKSMKKLLYDEIDIFPWKQSQECLQQTEELFPICM